MTEANITFEDASIAESGKRIVLIKISGQLDESNVDEKIKKIYTVLEQNSGNINLIFDLTELEYMNSKSIGYLTDIYGKVTDLGGVVVVSQAKENILDILNVVGLTQLINTFSTNEEAKNFIANNTASTSLAGGKVQEAPPATESVASSPVTPESVAPTGSEPGSPQVPEVQQSPVQEEKPADTGTFNLS